MSERPSAILGLLVALAAALAAGIGAALAALGPASIGTLAATIAGALTACVFFLAELSDELIDRLFADFGAIGAARLGERLNELNAQERQRLTRGKKRK